MRETEPDGVAVDDRAAAVQTVVDRVYTALRDRILTGVMPPGERLRQEALSVELGVSRTPLREALRRLAAENLVELQPNRGAVVADVRSDDLRAAYAARLVVEPAAARLAAERSRPEDVGRLRDATARQRAAAADLGASFVANRSFHRLLAAASGNPYLERFVDSLWVARSGAAVFVRQAHEIEREVQEHEAIVDAVETGDPDAAAERTAAHIDAALRAFLAGASAPGRARTAAADVWVRSRQG